VYAQPALLLAGLAAVEKLRAEDAACVERASACAGLSLGEYAALVFAGAMSLEDGLKVVKVRAEGMSAAAKEGSHGMLSVVGVGDKELDAMCADAVKKGPPGCDGDCARPARACAHLAAAPSAASQTTCSRRGASYPVMPPRWPTCRRRLRPPARSKCRHAPLCMHHASAAI